MSNLQKKIDEYNKQTKELVEGLTKRLDKVKCVWNDYDNDIILEYIIMLQNKHNEIKAFIDGCQTLENNLEFVWIPLIEYIDSLDEYTGQDGLQYEVEQLYPFPINFDNEITAFVHIK